LGSGPGSVGNTVAYGDDLSPSHENSTRPFSNGYAATDDAPSKGSSPAKAFEDRQRNYDGKDEVKLVDKTNQLQRSINRESPAPGINASGDTKDEGDSNRRDTFDLNGRKPQHQGPYNNMNNYRNDQFNRRGGGRGAGDREHDNFVRQQRPGNNNRDEEGGNSLPPPADFGDRYSANRSKDRDRRQQQHGNNDWGNNVNRQNEYHRGESFQRGGRGGRFDNYNRDGRNNQSGGPPRFNQRPDDRYNEPPPTTQPPPRFQRSTPGDSQQIDPNQNNASDRLAPRFKKLTMGQGPPERGPGDIGGGGPPPNREQGGRGMHNRQMIPDQRYQDRPPMFQQPPPNYQPDHQRNMGVHGPGKPGMDSNNPRMMFPGGPPPARMDREGSGGFTDRRSDSNGSNSRERELVMPGPMGPPKDVELSLRPPSANMLFKPKTPSLLPKSAIGRVNDHGSSPLGENSLLGPPPMQVQKMMMQQKEAPILIKQGSLDGKGRKEKSRQAAAAANKGPTREEVFERVDSIINEMISAIKQVSHEGCADADEKKQNDTADNKECDSTNDESHMDNMNEETKSSTENIECTAIENAANRWKQNDGWLPGKMTQTAVTHVYKKIVMKTSEKYEKDLILKLLLKLKNDDALDSIHFREAFDKMLNEKNLITNEKESENSKPRTEDEIVINLAQTAQWKIKENLASLSEIADLTSDKGNRVSVLLTTLQGLSKDDSVGQDELKQQFDSSNIKLIDHIEEENRNDAKLAHILKKYDLSFLMPLLSIRQEMEKELNTNPGNADALAKWISENVPSTFYAQDDFVVALFSVVFSHIVASTTLPSNEKSTDKTVTPEKSLIEAEKDLVSKFRIVLRPYVAANAKLQLTAVYALQVFNHDLGFPKGMLLRSFINCYELDILDEHAFIEWKEDTTSCDDYPGKGKALFQVNNWLTWLEEAESEEDEEDDD